jgi:hypothetical protein
MNVRSRLSSRTCSATAAKGRQRTQRRKLALHASIDRLEERALLAVTPVGPETLVNTSVAGGQGFFSSVSGEGQVNSVAADANGNYVVVWEGNGVGDSLGVFAQRFLVDGTPQGSEVRVNSTTAGDQRAPVVAMADDGSFAVAWDTPNPGTSKNRPAVIARVYNANGTARTGEIQVTAFSNRDGHFPTGIGMDSSGNFVVSISSWSGDLGGPGYNSGIVDFQRVSVSGQLQGKLTTAYTANLANNSCAVAMDAVGNFVMVWSGDSSIQAQRFDNTGKKLGSVITTGWNGNPSIARRDSGGFVIAGSRNAGVNGPADPGAGVARFYDASGIAQGAAFDFAYGPLGERAGVTLDPQGNAIFTWNSNTTGEVMAGRFSPAGTPLEAAVQVNTTTAGTQEHPSVTATANGDFVVVWDGNGAGDDAGVFLQRFATSAPLANFAAVSTKVPTKPTGGQTISLGTVSPEATEFPTGDPAWSLYLKRSRR